jgi:hypothetical protein
VAAEGEELLGAQLGIEPSPETQRMAVSLQAAAAKRR